jgi:hypothetical protein
MISLITGLATVIVGGGGGEPAPGALLEEPHPASNEIVSKNNGKRKGG